MTAEEKITFSVVFSKTNVPVILKTLNKFLDLEQPRIMNTEFETIVHNARIEGKQELVAQFEKYIKQ